MRHEKILPFSNESGFAICGDAFDKLLPHTRTLELAPLVILDPEYGRIVKAKWDKIDRYNAWFDLAKHCCLPDATICMWGGIGKPNDRPFFKFLVQAEHSGWIMKDLITWKKRRAYGKPRDYQFCREECAIFTRGEPAFNIPLLAQERGYPGYNKKYPAKSKYLRRSNVWADITELFRGKINTAQKPDRLFEVLIETHSNPGDLVVDLCAGSLTTARAAMKAGRRFYCVEKDANSFAKGIATLIPSE